MSTPGRILYFCLMNYLIISGTVGRVRKIHFHFTFCLCLVTGSRVIKKRGWRGGVGRDRGVRMYRRRQEGDKTREEVVEHNSERGKNLSRAVTGWLGASFKMWVNTIRWTVIVLDLDAARVERLRSRRYWTKDSYSLLQRSKSQPLEHILYITKCGTQREGRKIWRYCGTIFYSFTEKGSEELKTVSYALWVK